MKPFLLLQLRPIDRALDNEFQAFLKYGGLSAKDVHRVRMDKGGIPKLDLNDYSGMIIGGGPSNVSDSKAGKKAYETHFEAQLKELLNTVFEKDFPTLGCCYGIGAINKHQGGKVSKENFSESVGAVEIKLTEDGKNDDLLLGIPEQFLAYTGHKEACQSIPKDASLLAGSKDCPIQMIRFGKNMYATQFHPELDDEGIQLRINIYKDYGYFSPENAEHLANEAKKFHVEFPNKILRNFIKKYKGR